MNTGDRCSKRSCPRAYLCCKAVANRPSRRAPAPSRASALPTGWSLILSQPLSAASPQDPAAKAGFWSRVPSALRQPSPPAVSGSRRTAAAIFSLDYLRQRSFAAASSPPASSLLRQLSPPSSYVPSCGSHHRPSTSHRRFSNAPEQHLFVPLVMLRQHTNAASAMKRGFFQSLRLDHPRAASSPRPFRLAFPQEGGRTPHSRQQVISSAPGPWALRGIPLHAAMACTLTQRTRSEREDRRDPAARAPG